jgi:YebC/PmpR family DNA-binding regulatory protein
MSGHSKWSKIKHKKAINDAKRGKAFSKLLQLITSAVKDGGGDPDSNPSLRLLLDKAKSASLPKSNIERAIQRGLGVSSDGRQLENVVYEGYGVDGVGVIVEVISDNTNRTVAELRLIFSQHGGNLGESGSVSWNFKTVGHLLIASGKMKKSEKFGHADIFESVDTDVVIESIMELDGVEDIGDPYEVEGKNLVEVVTDPKKLSAVAKEVAKLGWVIEEVSLEKKPNSVKDVSEKTLEKIDGLLSDLEAHADVQAVWTELG